MHLDKLPNICYTVFSTSHKTDVQQDTGYRLVSACMPVHRQKKGGIHINRYDYKIKIRYFDCPNCNECKELKQQQRDINTKLVVQCALLVVQICVFVFQVLLTR